jgi:hypothetical protein
MKRILYRIQLVCNVIIVVLQDVNLPIHCFVQAAPHNRTEHYQGPTPVLAIKGFLTMQLKYVKLVILHAKNV